MTLTRNRDFTIGGAVMAAMLLLAATAAGQGGKEVVVSATRIGDELPGASTTIIDADEIARSPARTLPDLLGLEAGIQSRDLFGGTAGAQGTVDIRGFGAPGKQNTLFLLNGRRLNDIDLAAVDYASIPRDSIDRIEITRGNVGAVLYGDGAVGGVVNIITKSAAERAPAYGGDLSVGSDVYREANLSTAQAAGAYSVNAYGSFIESDGFRDNNDLIQRNLVAEFRRTGGSGDIFLRLNGDSQSLGLPGARRVTLTTSQLDTESDRRAATTPLDKSFQNGLGATAGVTHRFLGGTELIVDGGYRIKDQEAFILDNFGGGFNQFIDTELATWSLTPRVRSEVAIAGMTVRTTTGIDVYYSDYNSDRKRNANESPIHRYDAKQKSAALYMQNVIGVTPTTEAHLGVRAQRVDFEAGDLFDANAPGAFGVGRMPVDESDTFYAFNLGVDQRLTDDVDVFARIARSFRVPTVDERIGTDNSTSFALRTQTSKDAEIGARFRIGRAELTSSVFAMDSRNEIRFDPNLNFGFGANTNYDPIRRYGFENSLKARLTEDVTVKLNVTAVQARFRSGAFEGEDVPLVSGYTGRAAVGWRIIEGVTLDTLFTYASSKRMENDEANRQPKIPSYGLVDLVLRGELGPAFAAFTVSNLFDDAYYNYAVASTTTIGTFNAYPLPGRTFLLKVGARF